MFLLSRGQQGDADVQLPNLSEWHLAAETGVVPDDDVVDLDPQRKDAQRHLSQLHRPVEPLLQLGLDLPAILVDVNQVRKCKDKRRRR